MTISIELSPAEEARLAEEARRKGVDVVSLVRDYISQAPLIDSRATPANAEDVASLVENGAEKLKRRIPLRASPEDIEKGRQFFARMREEAAKMTPEEIEEDDRISAEIEAVLLANPRDLRLRQQE